MLFVIKLKRFKEKRVGLIQGWRRGKIEVRFDPKNVEVQSFPESEIESIVPDKATSENMDELIDSLPVKKVAKKKTTKKKTKKK